MGEDWAVVKVVGTDEEAEVIAGFLRSREVPTEIESLLFHQEPVNFGRLGEVRIRVPAEFEAEALRLLDEGDPEAFAGQGEPADDPAEDTSDEPEP